MRIAFIILGVCLVQPIWFYLLYQILLRVNASELMWFLYWAYVPLTFFAVIMSRLVEKEPS
jgi:hypothetical protein